MSSHHTESDRIGGSRRPEPDAHGQAALLLVESLLHAMLERGILTVDEAIGIAAAAGEVKEEIAAEATESDDTARHSLQLIARIVASLEYDRPSGTAAPGVSER